MHACCLQSLYDSMDDVKQNKADRTQVEVEVREVSPLDYIYHSSA